MTANRSKTSPGPYSVGFEHRLASGTTLTGVLPQKSYPDDPSVLGGTEGNPTPTSVASRLHSVAAPDDGGTADTTGGSAVDGNGLFDVHSIYGHARTRYGVWVTAVHCIVDPTTTWSASITSGLGDGDDTTIDDPANDTTVASGVGSAYVKIGIELPPNARVRIVTAGDVPADAYFRLYLTASMSEGGRLIS